MKNTINMTETVNNTMISLANQFASNPVEFNELINTITEEIDSLQAHFDKREEDLKALSGIIPSFPQAPNNKISVYKNRCIPAR